MREIRRKALQVSDSARSASRITIASDTSRINASKATPSVAPESSLQIFVPNLGDDPQAVFRRHPIPIVLVIKIVE